MLLLLLLLLLSLLLPQPATRERVVGAHFFSPAHVMPLLEIVRTRHTSKQVRLDGMGVLQVTCDYILLPAGFR